MSPREEYLLASGWPLLWQCGHPRTPDNTQSCGKAGMRCKHCRRTISRESFRRRMGVDPKNYLGPRDKGGAL